MNQDNDNPQHPLQPVLDYHEASKHHFDSYASGPGFLDWETQPNPFRRYTGTRLIALQTVEPVDIPRYDDVFSPARRPVPAPVDRQAISQLFFDSLALSAWKSSGATRWALRVNASSGNLHPTEAYLLCGPVDGLCNKPMVAHYAAQAHGLEVRAEFDASLWRELSAIFPEQTFFLGLSSIFWRESWKYGLRAYRYCMHDTGHALGALSVAAAGLGWQLRLLDDLGTDELALLLGTACRHSAEAEEPDLLLACVPSATFPQASCLPEAAVQAFASLDWLGCPNQLSPAHVDWGVETFAARVRKPQCIGRYEQPAVAGSSRAQVPRPVSLRKIIRQRRSAVALDGETRMSRDSFYRMLARTLGIPGAIPFSTLPWKPHIHLVLMVHRVEGLPRGLYLLVRDPEQTGVLQLTLTQADPWQRPAGCPDALPLYCLVESETGNAAREIACHQDIAGDGCFSLAMLAEYMDPLQRHGPWFYPRLYWEAGMIGQLLYLEAEAAGLHGTGIGCFFDDPMHDLLGLKDRSFQDIYHFTVGGAVEDTRLTTLPAYSGE